MGWRESLDPPPGWLVDRFRAAARTMYFEAGSAVLAFCSAVPGVFLALLRCCEPVTAEMCEISMFLAHTTDRVVLRA